MWKPTILNYTQKKNGKTATRSYSGLSAGGELSAGCAYIGRSGECLCMGHLHADPDGELKRLPMRDEDPSYLTTIQKRWTSVVESEVGLAEKDWRPQPGERIRKDARIAYGYILPLPNDAMDDPRQTRGKIEELLTAIYGTDTMDCAYALHKGEARHGEHEQNLHLHVFVRPRTPEGKKWRKTPAELLAWNEEKRRSFARILQSWGYETEFVPTGKGQRRMTRGEHAVFLEKEPQVVSEVVRSFGTALKVKNESSRASRWHASMALRWSAYDSAINNRSWADSLREQGWELCRGSGDRRTWQIRDIETGKTFALRRLFSCKEQEVESYLSEMRTAIEQTQTELTRIQRERPEAFALARRSGPTLGGILGDALGKGVKQEPAGALALLLLCPALIFVVAALLVAIRGAEANAVSDEKDLKANLTASWKEEKLLRASVKERLSTFVAQQKSRPLPSIRSTQPQPLPTPARPGTVQEKPRIFGAGQRSLEQAIKAGDLKTAGKLDANKDGIADNAQAVDSDGDGISDIIEYHEDLTKFHVKQNDIHQHDTILQLWDSTKKLLVERGKKEGGIMDYSITERLLKKGHSAEEIKTAFESAGKEIPKGALRCIYDTKRSLEDELSESEAYR